MEPPLYPVPPTVIVKERRVLLSSTGSPRPAYYGNRDQEPTPKQLLAGLAAFYGHGCYFKKEPDWREKFYNLG